MTRTYLWNPVYVWTGACNKRPGELVGRGATTVEQTGTREERCASADRYKVLELRIPTSEFSIAGFSYPTLSWDILCSDVVVVWLKVGYVGTCAWTSRNNENVQVLGRDGE